MIEARQYKSATDNAPALPKGAHPTRMQTPGRVIPYIPPFMHYGQHVEDWRSYLALRHETPTHFLKRRCIELGVSYADIVGPRRFRRLIQPRHQLMVEIKVRYPRLSLPHIGKMFGGRDHSVVLFAIRKSGIDYQPEFVAKYRDKVHQMWMAGATYADIGRAINFSFPAVNTYIKKQGWTRP